MLPSIEDRFPDFNIPSPFSSPARYSEVDNDEADSSDSDCFVMGSDGLFEADVGDRVEDINRVFVADEIFERKEPCEAHAGKAKFEHLERWGKANLYECEGCSVDNEYGEPLSGLAAGLVLYEMCARNCLTDVAKQELFTTLQTLILPRRNNLPSYNEIKKLCEDVMDSKVHRYMVCPNERREGAMYNIQSGVKECKLCGEPLRDKANQPRKQFFRKCLLSECGFLYLSKVFGKRMEYAKKCREGGIGVGMTDILSSTVLRW